MSPAPINSTGSIAAEVAKTAPASGEPERRDLWHEPWAFALVLALLLAVLQSTVPLFGAWRGDRNFMALGDFASTGSFVFVALAFAALTYCFVTSDFSVSLVASSSQVSKPLLYKFSGVWGNHEGSMVLWVLILTLFGALVATFGRSLPAGLQARVLSVQASVEPGPAT